jgi:hypothetical protein
LWSILFVAEPYKQRDESSECDWLKKDKCEKINEIIFDGEN